MALVLSDEEKMLQAAAEQFFAENMSVDTFRAQRDAHGVVACQSEHWQAMLELGWAGILVPEQFGGSEFGLRGLGVICTEAAKNLAATPLVSTAVLGVTILNECEPSELRDRLLDEIMTGQSQVAVTDSEINNPLNFVAEGMATTILCAPQSDGAGIIELRPEDKQPVSLLDHRDYARVDVARLECAELLAFSSSTAMDKIRNTGAAITACELFGISSEAFDRTLAYLREREQFGQKIGAFQALQHRMAKAYMQLQMLKSVIYDAMEAVESDRKDAKQACSHAKVLANQTAQLITTEAIQLHGGMGITDELDIGLFYKRARVLQSAWGSTSVHKQRFAEASGF